MGMFDWVNVEMDCPKCGSKLRGFQSKDSSCLLAKIDPEYVSDLYTNCNSCKELIQFTRQQLPERHTARETPYSRCEIEAMGFVLRGV